MKLFQGFLPNLKHCPINLPWSDESLLVYRINFTISNKLHNDI